MMKLRQTRSDSFTFGYSRQQHGISLIPVLIMSTLIAMMGVSAMTQTQLTQRFAANDLFRTQIYHDANSEVIAQVEKIDNAVVFLNPHVAGGGEQSTPTKLLSNNQLSVSSSVVRVGSLDTYAEFSIAHFDSLLYEVTTRVDDVDVRARSNQSVGFIVPVAK